MTAPILINSLDSVAIESSFEYRPRLPIAPRTHRSHRKSSAERTSYPFTKFAPPEIIDLNLVWKSLLEALPQGVVLVSRTLQPLYWNQKAKALCQALGGYGTAEQGLPPAISEACYGILRDQHALQSALVMECRTSTGHLVRVRAQLMQTPPVGDQPMLPLDPLAGGTASLPALVAVFLENCDAVMQQEMQIQQQKYDLTDREAEICMLLRQEMTYQEIAKALQISLNTVKTHVKNVYAKRRSSQGNEKFWCR